MGHQMRRNPAIMLSRVLGMIFIVICHIISYYEFIPGSNFLGQFFATGVHLFVFISGYLYGMKKIDKFGKWYTQRLLTVTWPAVAISMLVVGALFIFETGTELKNIIVYALDLEGLIFINNDFFSKFYGQIPSLDPLWFTTIIMLCYLLIPLLDWIFKKSEKWKSYSWFLVTFISLSVIICLLTEKVVMLYYFLYFSIGFLLGKIKLLDRIDTKKFIIYTLMFIVALVGRVFLNKFYDGTDLYVSYVFLANFIIGTWFVAFCSFLYYKFPIFIGKFADFKLVKIFEKYSFYVYLVHGIFCRGVFNFYEKFSLPVATVLFFACTIVSSILLKFVTESVSKPLLKRLK